MKLSDFSIKEQKILLQIGKIVKPNADGNKVFRIPICLKSSRYLQSLNYDDIHFLKNYPHESIHLGRIKPKTLYKHNWTKELIENYIKIKKTLLKKEDPFIHKTKDIARNVFLQRVAKLKIIKLEELEELLKTAKPREKKGIKPKEKRDKKQLDCYLYKGMRLPLCFKDKTDKEIFDYLFATRMLNKQA